MITIRLACLGRQTRLRSCMSEDTHFLVRPVYITLNKNEFPICVLCNRVGKWKTAPLWFNMSHGNCLLFCAYSRIYCLSRHFMRYLRKNCIILRFVAQTERSISLLSIIFYTEDKIMKNIWRLTHDKGNI